MIKTLKVKVPTLSLKKPRDFKDGHLILFFAFRLLQEDFLHQL